MKLKTALTPIAVAMFTVMGGAHASIQGIVEDNFVVDNENEITDVYPVVPTTGEPNGYIVIDAKEDVVEPGIDVYQQGYRQGPIFFAGCIMAKKSPDYMSVEDADTCRASSDTGKRFKLRDYAINEPIDIVFTAATVGQVDPTILYNVFAKITNDGGTPATGFKVELGTGIGASFMPSTESDGINLKLYTSEDRPWVGKYPGGLFGGSPAEGLPFFTTESAYYYGEQTGDSLTTNGVPPQYYNLFGLWQTLTEVPPAWIFDNDGRPWTDGKLVAYEDDGAWYTFNKEWTQDDIRLILEDFAEGGQGALPIDLNTLPAELDPTQNPYVDISELTAWLNEQAGTTDTENAIRDTEVVEVLVSYLNLVKAEVPQATIDAYTAQPVTVKFSIDENVAEPTPAESADWPLVATWYQDRGEEGLYVLEPAYVGVAPFNALPSYGLDGSDTVVTADDMATVVQDNTGGQTDYFGIPGYIEDVIEDLSNVNTAFAIELEQEAIPDATDYTMRITFIDSGPEVGPGVDDSTDDSSGGGGCTIGTGSAWNITMPAILLALLAFGFIRRRKQ
jgi:hypothetical protein